MRPRRYFYWYWPLLAGLLVLGLALALLVGSVAIAPRESARILLAHLLPGAGLPAAAVPGHDLILWQLRLPRVLCAALCGVCLSMSGAVMQGLFRNPLCDPYLLGIASGASAGAALSVLLHLDQAPLLLPAGAFLGGLVAVALVYALAGAGAHRRLDNVTLILAGVALSSFFTALTSLLTYLSDRADRDDLRKLVFWALGSLAQSRWEFLYVLAPLALLGALLLQLFARDLNALALGDLSARHLGLDPAFVKKLLLGCTTLLTATVVAFGGTIGFVGLVVPHAMRLLIGPDQRRLLPASALAGALFLLLCDTLARSLSAPAELPLGVVTALFGAPVFLYLLLAGRRRPVL